MCSKMKTNDYLGRVPNSSERSLVCTELYSSMEAFWQGRNPYREGRIGIVELLIKIACFVIKENNPFSVLTGSNLN
jgi:hypothetical protein